MRLFSLYCVVSLSFLALTSTAAIAQEATDEQVATATTNQIDATVLSNSYLKDLNGDGQVIIDAFGDSITRGRGDFISADEEILETDPVVTQEAGYPLRIEMTLGYSVLNKGVSGDRVVERGVERFAQQIPGSPSDIVVISGGSNDAFSLTSALDIALSVQKMINIALASGKQPVLATIPPTCCDRSGLEQFVTEYNTQYKHLGAINQIPVAQVFDAYDNICTTLKKCRLLNRPEGLHPNSDGYDVSGEAVIAALLKIDLLAVGGATLYEQALGLQPGSVITIPSTPAPAPAAVETQNPA